MSRQPTDRTAAWAQWSEALDGRPFERHVDVPLCGYWKARRFGNWTALCIDLVQDIDAETGELVADEELAAWWADGKRDDARRLWSYVQEPISAAAFARYQRAPLVTDLTRQVVT